MKGTGRGRRETYSRADILKESFSAWYRETDKSRAEEKLGLLESKTWGSPIGLLMREGRY